MEWREIHLCNIFLNLTVNEMIMSLKRLIPVRVTSKILPQDGSTRTFNRRPANYWNVVCDFCLFLFPKTDFNIKNTLLKPCYFTVFTLPHKSGLWVKYLGMQILTSNSTTVPSYPFAAGDFDSRDFRYAAFWSENVMSNIILELSLEL